MVETAEISTQTCTVTSWMMKILSFGIDQLMAEYHRKRYNNLKKSIFMPSSVFILKC